MQQINAVADPYCIPIGTELRIPVALLRARPRRAEVVAVAVNLLSNAIKYTPQGGRITLSLATCAEGWAVAVRDTGAGIAPEQQTRLFQRFSRLDTAENRRLSGVGLGLLMVRTVAERHGGTIGVSSRPGEGSVVTLRLPAA